VGEDDQNIVENNPDLAERVKVGDDQEVEEFVRENVFDRPMEFFNERNLSRAYRVFAGLLDYVRAGLGTEKASQQGRFSSWSL